APENGALGIILWRCLADVADMDRFAAVKILHLAGTEASGPDGAHLASVPHRDLIAGTDFRGRIAHSDGENVADRMEVLDVDPVDVGLREDLAARQGERRPRRTDSIRRRPRDPPRRWPLHRGSSRRSRGYRTLRPDRSVPVPAG